MGDWYDGAAKTSNGTRKVRMPIARSRFGGEEHSLFIVQD